MDTKTSSDESKSDEPQTKKVGSLGPFTLSEVTLVDKDKEEIKGYSREMLREIPHHNCTAREVSLVSIALILWNERDGAIETAQMQDRANNKIHARLMALENVYKACQEHKRVGHVGPTYQTLKAMEVVEELDK